MRKFIGYTGDLNMNMENFNQKMQDINEAVKTNIPKPQPIKPENIKGGCGCSKKKK